MNLAIEFEEADDTGTRKVHVNGVIVGDLRRPVWAGKRPGFFLTLDGVTWENAPGARLTADSGGGAKSTFVHNLTTAKERIIAHYKLVNKS